MKVLAAICTLAGAIMVSVAVFLLITRGFGFGSSTIIAAMACIGVPFPAFGIWGLYVELKPYHDERSGPWQ